MTIIGGLLILLSSERNLRKRQEAIELQARPGERAALVGGDEEVAEQREEAQEQTDRLQLGGRVAVSAVFVYYVVKMLHERIGVLKGWCPRSSTSPSSRASSSSSSSSPPASSSSA